MVPFESDSDEELLIRANRRRSCARRLRNSILETARTKRLRSGLPPTTPSTTGTTLAANVSADTVQENDDVEELDWGEDSDEVEGVDEEHSQSEGEDELEEEPLDDGDGEEEEVEDEEDQTDQEDDVSDDVDDTTQGQAIGGGDMVSNDVSSAGSLGTKSSMVGTFTDPDVLDCPICCEALTIPVFQCENGHIQCSSCCSEIGNKCPSCSLPTGYNRCRSIERIITSVKFPCQNSEYGCKETMLHGKREVHEEECIFAPCYCPLKSCDFVGSQKNLYAHFRGRHLSSAVQFDYRSSIKFLLECKRTYLILQEKTDGTIFVLNQSKNLAPHAINVIRIGALHSKEELYYDLSVDYEGSTLKLKSVSATMPRLAVGQPLRKYLLIPSDFVNSSGFISVAVCIKKRRGH